MSDTADNIAAEKETIARGTSHNIGLLGSWNVFDFGKRERTIKECNAQVRMAETALQLTRAKVAAAIDRDYPEMGRSRQSNELASEELAEKVRGTNTHALVGEKLRR
jgi:outer membrane protein TolC